MTVTAVADWDYGVHGRKEHGHSLKAVLLGKSCSYPLPRGFCESV
jgi:hypothetical protein